MQTKVDTGTDRIVAIIESTETPDGKRITIQHVHGGFANTISIMRASRVTCEPYPWSATSLPEFKLTLSFNYTGPEMLNLAQYIGTQFVNEVIEES